MTGNVGQPGSERAAEIAQYVEAVRAELADLPEAERDELLDDLSTHLTEVAAEDPSPLSERLGPPSTYAAELRATAVATAPGPPPPEMPWWQPQQAEIEAWLRRLNLRAGRLIGYERLSDFARLLIPAWWVLRGYLAAMLVVTLLGPYESIGILPRVAGSTVAGLLVLGAFVAGSIWLAHHTPRLTQWQRIGLYGASALLVLFALVSFADLDRSQRWHWDGGVVSHSDTDPYADVADVYVVDRDGRLLTGVQLLDQNGNPIDLGFAYCEGTYPDEPSDGTDDSYEIWSGPSYPRCPEQLPRWANLATPPSPSPEPSSVPTAVPTPEPEPTE